MKECVHERKRFAPIRWAEPNALCSPTGCLAPPAMCRDVFGAHAAAGNRRRKRAAPKPKAPATNPVKGMYAKHRPSWHAMGVQLRCELRWLHFVLPVRLAATCLCCRRMHLPMQSGRPLRAKPTRPPAVVTPPGGEPAELHALQPERAAAQVE